MAVLISAPNFAIAAEGAPRWERLLDQILTRAEAERADVPVRASSPQVASSLPSTPAPNATAANPLVVGYVRYFSGAGARQFQASRKRLEEYRAMIEEALDQEDLPRELMWIGLVESGYNTLARSPKNAVGIWQFIPETAQTFGLRVVDGVDERSDPFKSTRAAARYLKVLYAKFRDWPLVLAAYNTGERRVQKAMERSRTADFWHLAESGLLPRETQAYVPAVLAAQFLGEGHLAKAAPKLDPVRSAPSRVVFATFDASR